jgi:hypothetical protein
MCVHPKRMFLISALGQSYTPPSRPVIEDDAMDEEDICDRGWKTNEVMNIYRQRKGGGKVNAGYAAASEDQRQQEATVGRLS